MGGCLKLLCCLCCGCICLVAVSIGGLVAWVAHLKLPEAGVLSIEMNKLKFEALVKINVYSKLWINNPNGWPMSGTIEVLDANVTSLDKNNEKSPQLYIGTAGLSQPVKIATHANTTFTVELKEGIALSEVALLARLTADCGPQAKERTTKIAVHINKARISIWERHVPLEDLDVKFTATVPCPHFGDALEAGTANASPDRNNNVALLEAAKVTLPALADIEKLVCELASQKMIENRATNAICSLINKTSPDVKFNPDCQTLLEGVWDIVLSKCPTGNKVLPSPGDIEKLVCGEVTKPFVQQRATHAICTVVHYPNCQRAMGIALKAIADECRSPVPLPDELEKIACELAKKKDMEDKATNAVCKFIHSQYSELPASVCTLTLKKKWEALEAHCPNDVILV